MSRPAKRGVCWLPCVNCDSPDVDVCVCVCVCVCVRANMCERVHLGST